MNRPLPPCKVGDQIELIKMIGDPCPVEPGAKGVVIIDPVHFQNRWQISIDWENGRGLSLVSPPDTFRILKKAEATA